MEDSGAEVLLIQREFKRARVHNPVFVARSGFQAIDYLSGNGIYSDRSKFPQANLVLLDIYMPIKSGFEVLEWVRGQPELKSVRVLMLTGSLNAKDVNQAYRLGADSFLIKPVDWGKAEELWDLLRFWLRDVEEPGDSRAGTAMALRP